MIESLIQHLQRYAKLEDSVQVERFEATLNQIASLRDPSAIGRLLPFFDDQCKFPETMFSIIHTIEMFDDETYVREILKELAAFWKRSPYWATTVHYAILNSPSTREAYRKQLLNAAPATKEAANSLLTGIRTKQPKLAQSCDELLA